MAIGQGGYKGNLDEIMDSLGPQSDQGQFFKDFIAPAGEAVRDYVSQAPEFLSNMKEFWGKAWEPQFEGHQPLLDAPVVSAVTGPVDTALMLGSGMLNLVAQGVAGIPQGFSINQIGGPEWSLDDAIAGMEDVGSRFPTYHPQTAMGSDIGELLGSAIEGWEHNVAVGGGRIAQNVAELAGAEEKSAINWGAGTSGLLNTVPALLPFARKRRNPSDRPMYGYGYDAKNLRLALEDQIGVVKDFKFMSDSWRELNPEAWRAALEREVTEPGHFAREIERMQDVITQDLREVSFFIDEYATTEGLRIGAGLPKETFSDFISRLRREGNDVRMGYGQTGRDVALDPIGRYGGYFGATNRQTPLFTRDATGRMLPNWGRGHPYNHPLGRQRHIVIGKEGPAINNRWTPKHEWTHALDDILYSRLSREATAMDRMSVSFSPNQGMVPDYMGNMRWIPDLSRYRGNTMMSDLSPVLKDFSNKIVEVEWTKYTERVYDRTYTAMKDRLIAEGATEAEAALVARSTGLKAIKDAEAAKHDIIGAEGGIWAARSPLELRARLTGANDYLALAKKQTYDKLQNPTGSRPFKLEDLWTEKIPPRVEEVRNMIDDLVAYNVMTRKEATAYLKKVLDEVREPYTKLTTELNVGPGPGVFYGGEE